MSEITPPVDPQAGDAGVPQPQAGTTSPEPQAGDGNEQLSLDEARKLRSEHASLRKRLKAYEDQEEQQRQAALSDLDKATKRAEQAEAKVKEYQGRVAQYEVRLQAQSMGIVDPELASLAIQAQLEYDDDGMPTNVETALKALVKAKPFLVKPADPASSPPPSPAQTASAPQLPAMNPGRSNIQQPGSLPPGRIPTLADVFAQQKK